MDRRLDGGGVNSLTIARGTVILDVIDEAGPGQDSQSRWLGESRRRSVRSILLNGRRDSDGCGGSAAEGAAWERNVRLVCRLLIS